MAGQVSDVVLLWMPSVEGPTCVAVAPTVCVCAGGFDKIPTFPTSLPKAVLLLFLARGGLIVFVVLFIPTLIVVCASATILDTSVAAARSLPLTIV